MTSFDDAVYRPKLKPMDGPWFLLGDGDLPNDIWVRVGVTDGRRVLRGLYIDAPEITGSLLRGIPVTRILSDLWDAQAQRDQVYEEIIVRPEDIPPGADPEVVARDILQETYQRVLARYAERSETPRARVRGVVGPLSTELLTGEQSAPVADEPILERFVRIYRTERARSEHGAVQRAADLLDIHRVTASKWLTKAAESGTLRPEELPRKRRQNTPPPDAG